MRLLVFSFSLMFGFTFQVWASCEALVPSPREPNWATRFNLNDSDRAEIVSVFATHAERAENLAKVFAKYVDATIGKLPHEAQKRVRDILKREEIILVPFGEVYRGQMLEGVRIEIEAPDSYEHTATLYATRIHELQHLINFVMAGADLQRAIQLKRFYPWVDLITDALLLQRYYDEFSAIRAEWEFLSLIPPEVLEYDRKVIASSRLGNRYRNSQLRRLQNAHLPFLEYILAEHSAGRHSLRNFKMDIWLARATVSIPLLMFLETLAKFFI